MAVMGIYCISLTSSDCIRYYIGKSVNVEKRWRQHRRSLERGSHRNIHLQRAWDKYGGDAFLFSLICQCHDKKYLSIIEQSTIDEYRKVVGDNSMFNILLENVETRLGVEHSQETKKRLSQAQKENWENPLYRETQSNLLKEAARRPDVQEKRSSIQKEIIERTGGAIRLRNLVIESWKDPEIRNKMLDGMDRAREKKSQSLKKTMALPSVKKRLSDAQKISQNRPEVKSKIAATKSNPEFQKKIKIIMQEVCSRPEYREKQIAAQLIAQNRPETKKKKSEGVRAALSTEESKRRRKETNNRPEVKARRSAAAKAVCAARKARRELLNALGELQDGHD